MLVNDFYETVNSHKFSRNNDDFYLGIIFGTHGIFPPDADAVGVSREEVEINFPICLFVNLQLQLHNYNMDLCAPYRQTDGALHCHDVLTLKAVLN